MDKRDFSPGRGVSSAVRIVVATALGLAAGIVTVLLGATSYAPAIGWDVAALTFLVWVWTTIWPMGPADTAGHATREDPTTPVSEVILLVSSVISLAAVGFFLVQAGSAKGAQKDFLAATGIATVTLSWLLVHTVFTLRYAKLYYQGSEGGIDFNQTVPPRYSDFAYVAFTMGMTYQVADTDLKTPEIRATVLRHALLSYLLGAVVLATTINLIAGLGGNGH